MAKSYALEVKEGVQATLAAFFKYLLQKKMVDALLIPQRLPSGGNVVQSLVTSVDMLRNVDPLAPVMPVNSAHIVSELTKVGSSQKKVGVVLRPCELRAVVELVKLKQASLQNLVLIGVDCFGTYSVTDYAKSVREGSGGTEAFLGRVKRGESDPLLREACQVCEYPSPLYADIVIGLIGMDWDKGILLQATTTEGEKILEGLGLKAEDKVGGREAAIARLISERTKKRDELFERVLQESHGLEKLLSVFSICIGCHNCRDVCPICYCKECFFDSPTFEWEADKYLGWASRRGALRMPTDTLLFHLTRLNHMVASCVGCGMCQEACPNDVPVFSIFRTVGDRVQKLFSYVPGKSLEDQLPLATFKEAELEEVGYK